MQVHTELFILSAYTRSQYNAGSAEEALLAQGSSGLAAELQREAAQPQQDLSKSSSQIILWGVSPLGPIEICCEFEPYFYVAAGTPLAELLAPDSYTLETPVLHSLSGIAVQKLRFRSILAADDARTRLLQQHVAIFESDIRARERFLMDLSIHGSAEVEGEGTQDGSVLRMHNPRLGPARVKQPLRVCSLDIETSISSEQILSIAVHVSGRGSELRRVYMQGSSPAPKAAGEFELRFVANEKILLEQFVACMQAEDPDLLIGWNVIGFDLAYLDKRAKRLGVSLRLGRDRGIFTHSEPNGRFQRAFIAGRVVLDGPQLLRSSFYNYESYSLENVSQQVLGEGKLLASSNNKAREIEQLFQQDKAALAAYNFKDALLVTRIFERLGLLTLTRRRSELSGMLLDQVGFSTAAFDHLYLPKLHSAGYVAPDVGASAEFFPASGGHVIDPTPGIYQGIIALDFQSLYPSIIRTFKIDPLARTCADVDPIETPSGQRFSRTQYILPSIIDHLIEARRQAKREKDTALSQAIKILMNSFYGVLGATSCRFYDPILPEAITRTGQWLLVESKAWLEQRGTRVLYGDTDSLFVQLESARASELEAAGAQLASELSDYWRVRLQLEYGLPSYLLVEFKRHYRKFLLPAARGSTAGVKKRYAGMLYKAKDGDAANAADEFEFTGLEAVRSDWTPLAREFQRELYARIFREQELDAWVRSFIGQLRAGSFDTKLVYRKRLHKKLEEYGKSPPPYVRAAMLLSKPARDVRYVITKRGPIPLEALPQDPDYEHYIDKQLRPLADSVLELLGTSFEQITSRQLRLF